MSPTSPLCVARHLDAAVLDGLGRGTAYLVGHSWGGHPAFHAAVAIPDRLAGVLSVDPLGAVDDGGMAAFGTEMLDRVPCRAPAPASWTSRTPPARRPQEQLEVSSLWPSYRLVRA